MAASTPTDAAPFGGERPNSRAPKRELLRWLDRYVNDRHGGRCVSPVYTRFDEPHWFRCRHGHEFAMRPRNITQDDGWCGRCAAAAKLASLREFVRTRHGGRCLDALYTTQRARYRFRCAYGHEFDAVAANVLHHGSWCPDCAGNARLRIDTFKALADEHGGVLIDPPEHITSRSRLHCRCSRGHRFELSLQHLATRPHPWCLLCAREDELQPIYLRVCEVARAIDYECITPSLRHERSTLHLLCDAGHDLRCSAAAFLGGHRCPRCVRRPG